MARLATPCAASARPSDSAIASLPRREAMDEQHAGRWHATAGSWSMAGTARSPSRWSSRSRRETGGMDQRVHAGAFPWLSASGSPLALGCGRRTRLSALLSALGFALGSRLCPRATASLPAEPSPARRWTAGDKAASRVRQPQPRASRRVRPTRQRSPSQRRPSYSSLRRCTFDSVGGYRL